MQREKVNSNNLSPSGNDLETLPVDTRSGWLPHLVPRGVWFFSEVETLREFSRRLSRYPVVVSPRIGETMAPVRAARSPEQFFAWLNAQSGFHQECAAETWREAHWLFD